MRCQTTDKQQASVAPLSLRPPAHAYHFVLDTSTLADPLLEILKTA
ncbi:MAG: hypothetical protein JXA91_07735 [Candidatus Thermoplasmatota archaeon]|nr:hypothetical protein [Candidatus Thermoplasmatota archaeon]